MRAYATAAAHIFEESLIGAKKVKKDCTHDRKSVLLRSYSIAQTLMPASLLTIALAAALSAPEDSLVHIQDSMRTDTLREVTVRPLKQYHLSDMEFSGKMDDIHTPPSLSDILDKLSPGLNDKITHPFAIKQRKKERRRKRALKNLENYDRVKTFDVLLQEAYERQKKEDEGKE